MIASEEKHLLRLIRIVPVVSLIAFMVILNGVIISTSQKNSQASIDALTQQLIDQKKAQLKNDINRVIADIKFDQERKSEDMKRRIRFRVNEAHDIAARLHTNNQHLPQGEVQKLILQALRALRFDNQYGYYYIVDTSGTLILSPLNPEFEQHDLSQVQDVNRNFVVRDSIASIEQQGEGFYTYGDIEYEQISYFESAKVSYLKLYAPFNWIIGSGTTQSSIDHEIRQRTLHRLKHFKSEDDGYLFVMNSHGATLLHPNQEVIGVNRINDVDSEGVPFIRNIIDTAMQGSGFVKYHSTYKPAHIGDSSKISFVAYVPEWDWVIGTGMYTEDLDDVISIQKELLKAQNERKQEKLMATMLLVSILLSVIYLYFAHKIHLSFDRFRLRINRDFNSLNDLKDQLAYNASHDSLTKLPNRKNFQETVEFNIRQARKHDTKLALMFVDLDDFKKINDLYGHAAGDSLLRQLSRSFLQAIEAGDTVSRFGGDEFVFCFANIQNQEQGLARAQSIFDTVANTPIVIEGKQHHISLSSGITIFPEHGNSLNILLSNADMALYRAKNKGKNTYHLFCLDILQEQNYQHTLERELRQAIAEQQIYVEYQPQIDLTSGKLYGVEALARWHNPTLGQVPPMVFIEKAEQIGIINKIGDFIVARSCKEVSRFNKQTGQSIRLSINISPQRISNPMFVDSLAELVQDSDMECSQVTLEITENILIKDTGSVKPILHRLNSKGFSIALDDFGTGYSSMRYLNTLPIDELKIDRAFVEKLPQDKQSQSLVNAILAMSSSMRLRIVAEGIEEHAQHLWLAQNHCHLGQGYLFDKPLTIESLEQKYKQAKPLKAPMKIKTSTSLEHLM